MLSALLSWKKKICGNMENFKEILYNLGPKIDDLKDIAQVRRCFSKLFTNKTAFSGPQKSCKQ